MGFEDNPADDAIQLQQCIDEIKRLQAIVKYTSKMRRAQKAFFAIRKKDAVAAGKLLRQAKELEAKVDELLPGEE